MELQAVIKGDHRTLSSPPFRHRDGGDVEFTAQMAGDAVVDENAADVGVGGDLGELELGVLEGEDGLAEGMPIFGVFHSELERCF
ncbi:Uncharacterised protein [Mycobacteroides abscessus subsp. abscessus]|nr:Uncharacterised protein [Mycobacteroides abscessus subsp. abscessus]SIF38836.1 Uncharacterised protein [Mycobacteroides abscessus subsp. abscessus]